MIIIVQGSLINTDHILEITPISKMSEDVYVFIIRQVNGNEMKVYADLFDKQLSVTSFIERQRELQKLRDEGFDPNPPLLDKITNLRNRIVEVWSNNQTQIPQFNLE